jgi:hypothetical protein
MVRVFFDLRLLGRSRHTLTNHVGHNHVQNTTMTSFLLSFQRAIILISSLLGLGYALWTIYGRIVFALDGIQSPIHELAAIIFEVPILAPALMGLMHFQSKNTSKSKIPLSYLVYGLLIAFIIFMRISATDALEFGLPMVLFLLPICVIICFFLIKEMRNK